MSEENSGIAAAERAIAGALMGCVVGDSVGLAREGLGPRRAARIFGELRPDLFFGRSLVSDDTDQSCLGALAVLRSGGDVERFRAEWARLLRFWILSAPYGIGFGTLRAGLKLCIGLGPKRSGVYSAGNGAAMRAPILGVLFADSPDARQAFVRASTEATHSDPRALDGALLVAEAAARMVRADLHLDPTGFCASLEATTPELAAHLKAADEALAEGLSTVDFAARIGLADGVSGFVVHTVPVALYAALRHVDDPLRAVTEIILCGGDTDTTAAITGALVGARHGPDCWPREWIDGIVSWPYTSAWRAELAQALARRTVTPSEASAAPEDPGSRVWALPIRHLSAYPLVLYHALRRLFPPY